MREGSGSPTQAVRCCSWDQATVLGIVRRHQLQYTRETHDNLIIVILPMSHGIVPLSAAIKRHSAPVTGPDTPESALCSQGPLPHSGGSLGNGPVSRLQEILSVCVSRSSECAIDGILMAIHHCHYTGRHIHVNNLDIWPTEARDAYI